MSKGLKTFTCVGHLFQHEGAPLQHKRHHRRQRAHGRPPGEAVVHFGEDSAQRAAATQQAHPTVTISRTRCLYFLPHCI